MDEHSPSKVGYKIGDYFGQGFVNSLIDSADKSYSAGATIATAAKNGLINTVSKISEFIESGIDSQPTIRPVLDLSSVKNGTDKLSAMLSKNHAMKINSELGNTADSSVRGDFTSASGNNFSFVQNNYSPKSLSRVDIYRQTRNQFSAMERLVSNT